MRSTSTHEGLGMDGRLPNGALEIVHIGSLSKPLSAESGRGYLSELSTGADKQAGSQSESVGNESARSCPSLVPPVGIPLKKVIPPAKGNGAWNPGGNAPVKISDHEPSGSPYVVPSGIWSYECGRADGLSDAPAAIQQTGQVTRGR
jgi:hypothetical protein